MKVDENDILNVVSDNPNISQRKIAEKTGISVGKVNFLIKKCVKKGWIKIDHLNSRTVKYILTPKGIQEKTKLTLSYIQKSYKAIMNISDKIKDITKEQVNKGNKIIVYGEEGELSKLIELNLKEMRTKYIIANHLPSADQLEDTVIYIWDPYKEEELEGYNYINILNYDNIKKIEEV